MPFKEEETPFFSKMIDIKGKSSPCVRPEIATTLIKIQKRNLFIKHIPRFCKITLNKIVHSFFINDKTKDEVITCEI